MKTNISSVTTYLRQLINAEASKGESLGKHELNIIVHDKSQNINAGSLEIELKVFDDNSLLGETKCAIIVVEKTTTNMKTNDEFTRTCSIVMNNLTHEIIWNKMSRDSTIPAAEYCFGYLINNALIIRGKKPMRDIKDYVKKVSGTVNSIKPEPKETE